MTATPLTAEQRRLARCALGLPSKSRRSTRNAYYVAVPNHSRVSYWVTLIERGLASEGQTSTGMQFFAVSRRCAEAVLGRGESLCDAHFLAKCKEVP